ncbi:MAG: hypothetical protein MMC23_001031 [Stictis urceolatum]|nr:hypothetical protein [Stictis urceolata]
MTTALPSRPATNGTAHSSTSTNPPRRQPSLSSFPSRTPSEQSLRNAPLPARRYRGHGSQSSVQTSNSSQRQHSIPPTTVHRTRKLKSQYPADSTERHVEYILVASFDIDKGPVMEHQFPGPISGDEGMLAELMLPDQAHVRSEDWTIFFLHKDTSEEEGAREERRTERRQRREERAKRLAEGGEHMVNGANGELGELGSDVDSDEGGEGPPLIYVLNLVNMKQDKNARR